MFAPEYMWKVCPWWHKFFRRLPWFKCRCVPIKFKGVRLPVIPMLLPDLGEIAKVQPLTDSRANIFYLDVKYMKVRNER